MSQFDLVGEGEEVKKVNADVTEGAWTLRTVQLRAAKEMKGSRSQSSFVREVKEPFRAS